jgi:hypothetical protein
MSVTATVWFVLATAVEDDGGLIRRRLPSQAHAEASHWGIARARFICACGSCVDTAPDRTDRARAADQDRARQAAVHDLSNDSSEECMRSGWRCLALPTLILLLLQESHGTWRSGWNRGDWRDGGLDEGPVTWAARTRRAARISFGSEGSWVRIPPPRPGNMGNFLPASGPGRSADPRDQGEGRRGCACCDDSLGRFADPAQHPNQVPSPSAVVSAPHTLACAWAISATARCDRESDDNLLRQRPTGHDLHGFPN